jgi:6-methylsalicylate decarboxylase
MRNNSEQPRSARTSPSCNNAYATSISGDRRRFICGSCRTLLPDVNPIMLEIPQDTTRAVTNLLFSGTFTKFKDIRFIFTHAGGSVPMTVVRMHQYAPKNIAEKVPNGIEYELQRLHYDIAGTAYRPAIAALTSLVPNTQILFGSDNPFIPLAETAEGMMQLGLSADDLRLIGRDNALALLPRFKDKLRRNWFSAKWLWAE